MVEHGDGSDGLVNEEADRLAMRVARALYERDRALHGLGIRLDEVRAGFARVAMAVRSDMVNGHGVCHGGFIFALADSALAFACNSYNDRAVAAAASIDFLAPAFEGNELMATASELWRSRRNGLYEVVVTNQHGEKVAFFRGRSHRLKGEIAQE